MAERFEANRSHLQAVAYRMLGSPDDASDAVQDVWLRFSRSDNSGVSNLRGWLTTVLGRICLDMLRRRRIRNEQPMSEHMPTTRSLGSQVADPEDSAVIADSVGTAMLVVLETLSPAERIAFVLHDMFGLPFRDIAPIVDRSPNAARQLASRARRRVRGANHRAANSSAKQRLVEAFLAASRQGNFEALLAVLDPDIVLRADATVMKMGQPQELRGAQAVIENFAGRARGARVALIGGDPGAVWAPGGRPRVVFRFRIEGDRIAEIELVGDRERLDATRLRIQPADT